MARPSPSHLSTKRLVLCSREHGLRVAAKICDATHYAYVIRTGHPLQPYRASASATRSDEVETLLVA